MKIPFVDLRKEHAAVESDLQEVMLRVMESGWYILGDEVNDFESKFAEYTHTAQGIGMNSGTDALTLTLEALGIGPGDGVITVSHTFFSTTAAILRAGATPVFVDIDPETRLMDVSQLEDAVTEDTAAIVPVHLYGRPVDMDTVTDVAERHNLAVVEDACQAHGAMYRGDPVGSIGDVGCFSFYPVKNLGAYGDGGMAVTDDDEVAERLRALRNVGQTEKYEHSYVGANSRLDELQAAILDVKLDLLDEWNDRRRAAADRYRDLLADSGVKIPPSVGDDREHVYHLFVVQSERRDALRKHLGERGVDTLVHYPTPVHQQPSLDESDCVYDSLPVTERVASEIVSLPIHPWITDEELTTVANAVRSFETG